MKLWSYFRSSASYRVRIALHFKELTFEYVSVHLLKGGGEQHSDKYLKINPMGHVPALEHDGFLLAESMAIIDYLERTFPARPLFPAGARERAQVMELCELVNSGIQPLQNLKVNRELESGFGLAKPDIERWNRHWIGRGLESLERRLEQTAGTFCFGDDFSAADCFVVPQCFSSRRFGVRVEDYPVLARVEANALKLNAVMKAHPEKQPDFA